MLLLLLLLRVGGHHRDDEDERKISSTLASKNLSLSSLLYSSSVPHAQHRREYNLSQLFLTQPILIHMRGVSIFGGCTRLL